MTFKGFIYYLGYARGGWRFSLVLGDSSALRRCVHQFQQNPCRRLAKAVAAAVPPKLSISRNLICTPDHSMLVLLINSHYLLISIAC